MPINEFFFIESLSSLYEAVQSQKIFADSKHFVDGIPVGDPTAILAQYEQEKAQAGFDLRAFVATHFRFADTIDTHYESANKPLLQHLRDLWQVLTRPPSAGAAGTLIPLPYPYIVPGGRFREVYYWDSYFTMLGLQVCRETDSIRNMVNNFAWLLDEVGFIPNGNRTYYLGRSQPPFFSLMVELLAEEDGEKVLLHYRPQLEKEYAFWMQGAGGIAKTHRRVVHPGNGVVLNRYWDDDASPRPEAYTEDVELAEHSGRAAKTMYRHIRAAAESGWDFSCRWFADGRDMSSIQTTDLLPVDLNCLMLHLEETLLRVYTLSGDAALVAVFSETIQQRKNAIQRYCWDEVNGFYFDYNHHSGAPSDRYTLAAVYPLFFGVASAAQATRVAQVLETEFLREGGLVTTLYATGQQWDAPNGWAPLQWMAWKGLMNYGHTALAGQVRQHWTGTNEKVYAATGKMMEKYNVVDTHTTAGGGEYENQDGFGWTNGVYLKLTQ